MPGAATEPTRLVGRYALFGEIASGGMATVHFGRLVGPVGFTRTVAIKRLHSELAKDPEFVSMFLDEARLAARIAHPNVVATLDVVAQSGELFLVMEYVQGESAARLMRSAWTAKARIPPAIAAGIAVGVLNGLHAAHEAKSERGESLGIVHRDVSPQNVLVCRDGVPRVIDFGVAKAAGRVQTTRGGQLKGKLSYMAPEQLEGNVDRRTDIYAASVVFWELLAGRRLFQGMNEGDVFRKVTVGVEAPPGKHAPDIPPEIDAIVLRGLSKDPAQRFATAREMSRAIEAAMPVASGSRIGEWVEGLAGQKLDERAAEVFVIESSSSVFQLVGAQETRTVVEPSSSQAPPRAPSRPSIGEGDSQVSGRTLLTSSSRPARPSSMAMSPPVRRLAIGVGGVLVVGAGVWMIARLSSPKSPSPSSSATGAMQSAGTEPRAQLAELAPSASGSAPEAEPAPVPTPSASAKTPSVRRYAPAPKKKPTDSSSLGKILDTHK